MQAKENASLCAGRLEFHKDVWLVEKLTLKLNIVKYGWLWWLQMLFYAQKNSTFRLYDCSVIMHKLGKHVAVPNNGFSTKVI